MMVSYLDMAMVSVVPGIAVEYPVFDRVANVGCRRGGGSARKTSYLPKYFAKRYIAFTFTFTSHVSVRACPQSTI